MPDVKEIQAQTSTQKYGPKATFAQVSVLFIVKNILNQNV